jgi:glycosyltransferase involved in cell wall biosynthesis
MLTKSGDTKETNKIGESGADVGLDPVYDTVFVLNYNSRGWILEKICKIVQNALSGHSTIIYTERNDKISGWLPPARNYFFGHYKLFVSAFTRESLVRGARNFVWFTHPTFADPQDVQTFLGAMRHADGIFTANTSHREALEFLGLDPARLYTIIGGADPAVFKPKKRSGRPVGIVGAYYERKCPDLILAVIKAMPETQFLLIAPDPTEIANAGLSWENYDRFSELLGQPNFRYITATYADFPVYFDQFDVYLSLSNLEGGPIPLIEAMFANCVPVVTRTGFAEDIVNDGVNGRIISCKPSVELVVEAITWAGAELASDIRASVLEFSWEAFGSRFALVIEPTLPIDREIGIDSPDLLLSALREGWVRNRETVSIANLAASARLVLPIPDDCLSVRFELDCRPPVGWGFVPLDIMSDGVWTASLELPSGLRCITLPLQRRGPGQRLELIFKIDGPPKKMRESLTIRSLTALSERCEDPASVLFARPVLGGALDASELQSLNSRTPDVEGVAEEVQVEGQLLPAQIGADASDYFHFKIRELKEKLRKARAERDKYFALSESQGATLQSQKTILRNKIHDLSRSNEILNDKMKYLSKVISLIGEKTKGQMFERALKRMLLSSLLIRLKREKLFDVSVYKELNPDVPQGDLDALRHFLEYGISENRECVRGIVAQTSRTN